MEKKCNNTMCDYLIEAKWCIFASVSYPSLVKIGSPGRLQAIILINYGILLVGRLRTHVTGISVEIDTFSYKKMQLKCRLTNGGHFVSGSRCYIQTDTLGDIWN